MAVNVGGESEIRDYPTLSLAACLQEKAPHPAGMDISEFPCYSHPTADGAAGMW